jgi:hypothetical protein
MDKQPIQLLLHHAWLATLQSQRHSVIVCYIEQRPFEEPTQGSLAILATTANSQLSYHNWYGLSPIQKVKKMFVETVWFPV